MLPLGNPHLSRGHEGEGKEGRREAREWILRQLSDVGEGEGKGSGVGDTRSLSSSFSWDENLVAASLPPARPPAEQSKSKKPIHKFRSPHPFLFRALCCVPPFFSPPPYDRGSDSGGGILITIAFSSSLSFHPFLLLRIQNFSSLGVSASLLLLPSLKAIPCLGIFFSCLGQARSSISSAPSSSSPSEASLCFSAFLLLLLIPAKSLPLFLSSPSGNLFFPAGQLTVLGSKSERGGKGKRNVAPSFVYFFLPFVSSLPKKASFLHTAFPPLRTGMYFKPSFGKQRTRKKAIDNLHNLRDRKKCLHSFGFRLFLL